MNLKSLLLSALGLTMTAFAIQAAPFEVGGIYYEVIAGNDVAVVPHPDGTYLSVSNANIPPTVEFEGNQYNVKEIADEAFRNAQLQQVSIPASLTRIGSKAFMNSSLSMASLQASGEQPLIIADSAFINCQYLYSVMLPARLKNIGAEAFKRCQLEEVVIPSNVESIGNSAFAQNYDLTSVEFQTGRTSSLALGTEIFANCVALSSFQLPGSISQLTTRMFYNTGFTQFTIPATIDTIASQCFAACRSLEMVDSEAGGANPFILQDSAFAQCPVLVSCDIPDRTKIIGNYAFYANPMFSKFTVKQHVDTIGEYAFAQCPNILSIAIQTDKPPVAYPSTFTGFNSKGSFYVQEKSFSFYEGLEAWTNYYPAKFNLHICHNDGAYQYNTLCVTSEMNPSFVNKSDFKAYKIKEVDLDRQRVVAEQVQYLYGNMQPQGDCIVYRITTPDLSMNFSRIAPNRPFEPDQYLQGVAQWSHKFTQPEDQNITYYYLSRSTGKWRKIPETGTYLHKSQAYLCAPIPQSEAPDELSMKLVDVPVVGDINSDGVVNVTDLNTLVNMILGVVPLNQDIADLDGDGVVNTSDITLMIAILLGRKIQVGDVNLNGEINVSDVTTLVNMILGVQPIKPKYADIDGNGKVNVSDVTALIKIILGN